MRDESAIFHLLKLTRVKAICHKVIDTSQPWNKRPVVMRPSVNFVKALNATTLALLLHSINNARLDGRIIIREEDVPSLESLGLENPSTIGVEIQGFELSW